jgi:predicted nucleotidyltransferase
MGMKATISGEEILMSTFQLPIELPTQEIESFCRRWKVAELSLFGSVL